MVAPENFFFIPLAHIASLPAQAVEHPNAILEPNLDSNAHPNPQPAPNPTPNPTHDPSSNPSPSSHPRGRARGGNRSLCPPPPPLQIAPPSAHFYWGGGRVQKRGHGPPVEKWRNFPRANFISSIVAMCSAYPCLAPIRVLHIEPLSRAVSRASRVLPQYAVAMCEFIDCGTDEPSRVG